MGKFVVHSGIELFLANASRWPLGMSVPEIRVEDEEDYAADAKICPHLKKGCRLRRIEPKIRELKNTASRKCKSCIKEHKKEPVPESVQLWLCLGCGNLFCGRYDHQHALKHYERDGDSDCLMWNVESHSCWCYLCDDSIRPTKNRNEVLVQIEKYWMKHAEAESRSEAPGIESKVQNYRVITPGLQNLGNTCFFNSVIQLLASVTQLHEIISPHPLRERSTLEILSTTGLTMAFTRLLSEIYQTEKEKAVLRPGNLFGEIHRKFPMFQRGVQQDAQELFHYLLEGLKSDEVAHQGARPDLKRSRSRRRTTGEEEFEMTVRSSGDPNQKDFQPSNYIESIFEGRLASIVVCSACKNISTTYDQFEELSLSIVQEKTQVKERKGRFRAAIGDIGRRSRNSLSLTRSSTVRKSPSHSFRARDSEPHAEEDTVTNTRLPKGTTSMSEAVSEEEETEDALAEKQLKSHTFSMSDAKTRLERLSFAFTRRQSLVSTSPHDFPSPPSTAISNGSNASALPAASLERIQYIERLLQEPEASEPQGTIEDSLRDFTMVECLDNDNAFACEECAKLIHPNDLGAPSELSDDMDITPSSKSDDTKHSSFSSAMPMDIDQPNDIRIEPPDLAEQAQHASVSDEVDMESVDMTVERPKHIMRKAYKRFLIADLPNILILHLKRFQQSGKSVYSSLRKNDALVLFEEHIDLSSYLMPRPGSSQYVGSSKYRCIGAIVHIGTINSGHYVAYFLSHKTVGAGEPLGFEPGSKTRQWVFASDATTRPCSWSEVSKSRAYMIWYERM